MIITAHPSGDDFVRSTSKGGCKQVSWLRNFQTLCTRISLFEIVIAVVVQSDFY